jgi:hypothetical protein
LAEQLESLWNVGAVFYTVQQEAKCGTIFNRLICALATKW